MGATGAHRASFCRRVSARVQSSRVQLSVVQSGLRRSKRAKVKANLAAAEAQPRHAYGGGPTRGAARTASAAAASEGGVSLGLGRIVALYCHSSTLYQIL